MHAGGAVKAKSLDSPAYVMFTSGTTGKPMGVEISQKAIVQYVRDARGLYGFDSASVMPVYSAVTFDFSLSALLLPLLSGGRVEVLPRFEDSTSILANWGATAISTEHSESNFGLSAPCGTVSMAGPRFSHMKVTPLHLRILFDLVPSDGELPCDTLVVGGEAFPENVLRDLVKKKKNEWQLFDEHGPTEMTIGCFTKRHIEKSVRQSHACDPARKS